MSSWKNALRRLENLKYPFLILLLGAILMMKPGSAAAGRTEPEDPDLQTVLSCTQGVGEARVILSEHGVVVVCSGADDPQVSLEILQAVGAYTGFGSDRIKILKMADIVEGGKGK